VDDPRATVPVFVGPATHRARAARAAGWAGSALVLTWLVLVAASLTGASWVPKASFPGIGSVLPRPHAPSTGQSAQGPLLGSGTTTGKSLPDLTDRSQQRSDIPAAAVGGSASSTTSPATPAVPVNGPTGAGPTGATPPATGPAVPVNGPTGAGPTGATPPATGPSGTGPQPPTTGPPVTARPPATTAPPATTGPPATRPTPTTRPTTTTTHPTRPATVPTPTTRPHPGR
jgi:hypothetical protein